MRQFPCYTCGACIQLHSLASVYHHHQCGISIFRKMDTLEPHSPYISTKSESNSKPEIENRSSSLVSSPVPPPASMLRLWRPAAQRNLRNQWSKMASYRQQWISASSNGRSHATSLVNSYLSQRYCIFSSLYSIFYFLVELFFLFGS